MVYESSSATPASPGSWPPPAPLTPPPQRLAGLGLAVQLLLGVQFVAAALTLVAAVHQRSLIAALVADEDAVSLAEAESSDRVLNTLGVVMLLLYLATGIVWIVWLHRARTNVDSWDPQYQRRSPGWAIGAWFIPFVNLVLPAKIMNDVLADTERVPGEYRGERPVSKLLVAWALAFAAITVLGLYENIKDRRVDAVDATVEDVLSSADATVVRIVVMIVAAVLAFFLVRRITDAQQARLATPWAA